MASITRREALALTGAALAGAAAAPGARAEAGEVETHGLSTFGDLALPADFPHFPYVDPASPKGGRITLEIKQASGNQNFYTFDTLHTYVLKGDGAAGMAMTFDALMAGSGDEPDAAYGLVARAVRVSADKLSYRFLLRPEARFHDGSRLTAKDVAFSLDVLKTKGHPTYRMLLSEMESAAAEADDVLHVRFVPTRSRDAHMIVAGMPIFSSKWWEGRDFEASTLETPLGSGAYRVERFETGRFIEFERVKDYWAATLPVNVGLNNLDRVRYEYFRERQAAFEAFKSGVITFNEEYTSRIWHTGYDFPALREGKVKKENLPDGKPIGSQGWYFNTRREQFADPRVREALAYAFDYEWTNANVMYGAYKRMQSFFQNSDMQARGAPGPEELKLLEPFRGKVPDEVFGEPWVPPVSDGSGSDRNLLRRADELLRAAGCKRDGGVLKLPNGKAFEIEFLDSQPALQPHTQPFQANLKKLGIAAQSRIVDAAQYRRRLDSFDFDIVSMALGGSVNPGAGLRNVFSSQSAGTNGSRNVAGVRSPAVDAMIERIANATTKAELQVAARALDRLLRAGRYWIPMWFRDEAWVAYWDAYARPATRPKYGSGAPDLWRWDPDKAKRIGLSG
ncbi:MAG: ABC transporter substrate-binding protein [Methylobacteriaceae bacterium]|nr:ABC transporter substrate-binding protein [Methylobacteriaceae bacterium]